MSEWLLWCKHFFHFSFLSIQLAFCLASRADTHPVCALPYHRPCTSTCHSSASCLITTCSTRAKSVRAFRLRLHFLWKESELLVCIWCTGKPSFLSYPAQHFSIFNLPLLSFFFFSSHLIAPIPFCSQVHLARIQEFSSALERLVLYLKAE